MAADARFEREVLPHLETVRRFAYRLTRDRATAEDFAQQSMLRAFESFGRYQERGAARAWLCTIVLNEARNWQREHRRRAHLAAADALVAGPASDLGAERRDVELRPAIEALSPRLREVMRLRAQRLSYKQIAERLGVPMGTVMSRLSRARVAIRRSLAQASVSS